MGLIVVRFASVFVKLKGEKRDEKELHTQVNKTSFEQRNYENLNFLYANMSNDYGGANG